MTALTAFQILDTLPTRGSILAAWARDLRAFAARRAATAARRRLPRSLDLPAHLRRDLGLLG